MKLPINIKKHIETEVIKTAIFFILSFFGYIFNNAFCSL